MCQRVLLNEAARRQAGGLPSPTLCPHLTAALDANLHSPERQLIELRMAHAELDAAIDLLAGTVPVDELMLRRLKKRRLALRDQVARLALSLDPKEPA